MDDRSRALAQVSSRRSDVQALVDRRLNRRLSGLAKRRTAIVGLHARAFAEVVPFGAATTVVGLDPNRHELASSRTEFVGTPVAYHVARHLSFRSKPLAHWVRREPWWRECCTISRHFMADAGRLLVFDEVLEQPR
jgi:hypothetical protein